tara:strand:+ start:4740 stop:5303 length:564 start_codon:yes stop_codon:yes gene_type:complete
MSDNDSGGNWKTNAAKFLMDSGGKANPYVIGAGIIMGGISFFKSRKAEKRRRARLMKQYESDVQQVRAEIPEITQEYRSTADFYRDSGNLTGQRIYENALSKIEGGGQSNLVFGGENRARGQMQGLLGMQLGSQALQTRQYVDQTQNQLGSELNRAQASVDDLRAAYAKEGIYTPEVDLNTNNMKYV